MMKKLNALFESMVEVPRIRIGGRQTIETLIDEEASLLAKFLRDELNTWGQESAFRMHVRISLCMHKR
jgi:hypothetical protein